MPTICTTACAAALASALLLPLSAGASVPQDPPAPRGTAAVLPQAMTDRTLQPLPGDLVGGAGQRAQGATAPTTQLALVSSCSDPWYWRSLIEEFSCGLSGQGWTN